MDQKTIQQITKLVTELVRNERKRQFQNESTWRYKNTKLLLKNYDILKEHSKDIDMDIDQYLRGIFEPEDLKLRSIMGYKARTKKMVEYTDFMLDAYESYVNKRDDAARRRYFVIMHMFINRDKWTFFKIADFFDMSEKTIKRDQKLAIQEFSIFLFGIVSLEEMVS